MAWSQSLPIGRSCVVEMARVMHSGARVIQQRPMMPHTGCTPSFTSHSCRRNQHTRARNVPETSKAHAGQAVAVDGVNESQRLAVQHDSGCCRVMAGPGSGKTRVCTLLALHCLMRCSVASFRCNAFSSAWRHQAVVEAQDSSPNAVNHSHHHCRCTDGVCRC